MKIENTKAQMRKGVLEYCILSILKDEDAYVAEILDTLKDAKLLVVEGTIYPLLTRLKNAGYRVYIFCVIKYVCQCIILNKII